MVLNGIIRVGNYFLLGILLLLAFLYFYGIVDVLIRSDSYMFGTEVAGWKYYSRFHYLGSLGVELVVSLVGVAGGRFFKLASHQVLFRFSLVAVLVFWTYLIPQ